MWKGHAWLLLIALLSAFAWAEFSSTSTRSVRTFVLSDAGEHSLRLGGVLTHPDASIERVDEVDGSAVFALGGPDTWMSLDFETGHAMPENGMTVLGYGAHPAFNNNFELRGLQPGTSVVLTHSSAESGKVLVDGREARYEGTSQVMIHGMPSNVTIDLRDFVDELHSTVFVGTAQSDTTGGEVLIISSEENEFLPVHIQCDGIDTLRVILSNGTESAFLGDIPYSFVGFIHFDGSHGDHDVTMYSERETSYSAHINGRLNIQGRAPCSTTMSGPSVTFGGTCMCTGTESLSFVATGPNGVVTLLASSSLQLVDGPLTISASSGSIVLQGSISIAGIGTFSANSACTAQDCTGMLWDGSANLSGGVSVTASGTLRGVHIVGSIVAASALAPNMGMLGTVSMGSSMMDKTAILFEANSLFQVDGYDVNINGQTICTGQGSPKCNGVLALPLSTLSFHRDEAEPNLVQTVRISGTAIHEQSRVGVELRGSLDLVGVRVRIEGPTGAASAGGTAVGVLMDQALVTGRNVVIDIVGQLGGSLTAFRQCVSIANTNFNITPGTGGNAAVEMEGSINSLVGEGAFFEFAGGTWMIPTLTISSSSSTSFGGFTHGIDSDAVMIFSDILTVDVVFGNSDVLTLKAGWKDDSSVITAVSVATITVASHSMSSGSYAVGIDWLQTSITSAQLTVDAFLNNVGRTTVNRGIQFETVAIDLTSAANSLIAGTSGGGLSGTSNHGILFRGTNSIQSLGQLTLRGTGAPQSDDSHGIVIAPSISGSAITYTGLGGLNLLRLEGSALATVGNPNNGILMPIGAVISTQANSIVRLVGACDGGASACVGIQMRGAINTVDTDLAFDGVGTEVGVLLSGSIGSLVSPRSMLVVGGCQPGSDGTGILISNSFTFTGVTQPSPITLTGTGGSGTATSSAHGVLIEPTLSLTGELAISGTAPAAGGAGNHGVLITSSLATINALTIDGVACQGSGTSDCSGVRINVGVVVQSTSTSGIAISGSVSSGNEGRGVAILGTVNAVTSINLSSPLAAGFPISPRGIYITGTVRTNGAIVIDAAGVGLGTPVAVFLGSGAQLRAASIVINGQGQVDSGMGVWLASGFQGFERFGVPTFSVAITASGRVGVRFESVFSLSDCDFTVDVLSPAGTANGYEGVQFIVPFVVASNSQFTMNVDVGTSSSNTDSHTGIVIGTNLDFSGSTATTINAIARGRNGCIGINWISGDIVGSVAAPIFISGSTHSGVSGSGNRGIVANNGGQTATVTASISFVGVADGTSPIRFDDVGIEWSSSVQFSNASPLFDGHGGPGSYGNAGVLFSGGSIEAIGNVGITVGGTGRGTGCCNVGVIFGAGFTGFSSSSAGSCSLVVDGTASSTVLSGGNHGISFGSPYAAEGFDTTYNGKGFGLDGSGIYMGSVAIDHGSTSADSVFLNGTATGSAAYGILCDGCAISNTVGDLYFFGLAPTFFNQVVFSAYYQHPPKLSGDVVFESVVVFRNGFDLTSSGDIRFESGVSFDSGTSNLNGDFVRFGAFVTNITVFGTDVFGGADLNVSGTTVQVFSQVRINTNSMVSYATEVDVFNECVFLFVGTGSVVHFASNLVGDNEGSLQFVGDGLVELVGEISNVVHFLLDTFTTLEFIGPSSGVLTASTQTYEGDVVFNSACDSAYFISVDIGFSEPFVDFSGDISGSSPTEVLVISPDIEFHDGTFNWPGTLTLMDSEPFQITPRGRSSDYLVGRGATAVSFGDCPATLAGSFAMPVTVEGGLTVITDAAFSVGLTLKNNTWLKPGASVSGTGCFDTGYLELLDDSILVITLDGAPPSPMSVACPSASDQISAQSLTIDTNVVLNATVSMNVPRGGTSFIVTGPVISSGTFAGLPEGAPVSGGIPSIISYVDSKSPPGPGLDISLRTNSVPTPQDDFYQFVPPYAESASGVLLNDTDPDSDMLIVANTSPLSPTSATCTLSVSMDGSFTVIGQCDPGGYTAVYIVTDGLESASATITLDILSPSPSPTPTGTPTHTQTTTGTTTGTPTPSISKSSSISITPTTTSTPTSTTTSTQTSTQTPTASPTFTKTSTPTASETPTPTSSTTPTKSATLTPTSSTSPTYTPTSTSSETPSTTMTRSATTSSTQTASVTPSVTATSSPTVTPSLTSTGTVTPTSTLSLLASPSKTPTKSKSQTPTLSQSNTPTRSTSTTRTPSKSSTSTQSPFSTPSSTQSLSTTTSKSRTPSVTSTPTKTATKTPSQTRSPTSSLSSGATPSATASTTQTLSATRTQSSTTSATATATPTGSTTSSPTPTKTTSITPSGTLSPTATGSSTMTPTTSPVKLTPSGTRTPVPPSATPSPTPIRAPALPSQSPAKASRSMDAAPPAASAAASFSRSRSNSGLPGAVATTVPNRSASICVGTFCAVQNPPTGGSPNMIPLEVQPLPTGSETIAEVRNSNGEEIGRVRVPGDTGGAILVVNQPSGSVQLVDEVVTDVVEVTIVDSNGNSVESFDGDELEICFSTEEFDENDVCLGFYNEDNQWECQDYCLEMSSGSDGEDLLCGSTPHLTNFALLLSDEANSSSRCGSSSTDLLFVWLSVAAVGFAVIIVLIAVLTREVYFRYDAHKTAARLTLGSSGARQLSGGTSEVASFQTD